MLVAQTRCIREMVGNASLGDSCEKEHEDKLFGPLLLYVVLCRLGETFRRCGSIKSFLVGKLVVLDFHGVVFLRLLCPPFTGEPRVS